MADGKRELRRKHDDAAYGRASKLWPAKTMPEIADGFNRDEFFNSLGQPWNKSGIERLLKSRMPPGEYAAKVKASHDRTGPEKDAEEKAIARAVELRRAGLSEAEVTAKLAEEGHTDGHGGTMSEAQVASRLRAAIPAEERASLRRGDWAKGGRKNSAHAAARDAEILAIFRPLLDEGLTVKEAMRRLDGDGKTNAFGRRFNLSNATDALRRALGPDRYAALIERSNARNAAMRAESSDAHYDPMLPRLHELRRGDLSYEKMRDQLHADGFRNSRGNAITVPLISRLLKRYPIRASGRSSPVVILDGGHAANVLGIDGLYRTKELTTDAQREVVAALFKAGAKGLKVNELVGNVRGGAMDVLRRLEKDSEWAAVLYRPDRGKKAGWRFGPPRSINL